MVLHVCGHFAEQTGLRRIALAGGVALNCTANGKLMRSGLFDEVYVQPVAGDDGVALGPRSIAPRLPAWFPTVACRLRSLDPITQPAILKPRFTALPARSNGRRFDSVEATCAAAAKLIADGRVIAWYRGRMEYGPRALGNRSILADPGHPEMRDRINAMVKKREAFRPFAPACSVEEAHPLVRM